MNRYSVRIGTSMTTEIDANTAMQAFCLACELVLPKQEEVIHSHRAHAYGRHHCSGVVSIPKHQVTVRIHVGPAQERFVPQPIRRMEVAAI